MFNLLGMKPEEIITQAQGAVKALEERLACLEDRLAAIQRTLEYEYGRPGGTWPGTTRPGCP